MPVPPGPYTITLSTKQLSEDLTAYLERPVFIEWTQSVGVTIQDLTLAIKRVITVSDTTVRNIMFWKNSILAWGKEGRRMGERSEFCRSRRPHRQHAQRRHNRARRRGV